MKEKATKIVRVLQQAGFEAVFAGGCVRDELLNITPKDYDIATSATPDQVESLFERTIPVGKSFGVVRVLIDNIEFEVATFRSDSKESDGRRPNAVSFCSMEEDAKRRDFTINGLFYDPISDKLYDFVNGKKDIDNCILRFIGNPEDRIEEDKLRMMRFCRFVATLDFLGDKDSLSAVKRNAYKIQVVSKERIREELVKSLSKPNSDYYVSLLLSTNLMNFIIPEFYTMVGNKQTPQYHPEGTVDIHSLLVLGSLNHENYLLKLAGLLHDIGKPFTQEIEQDRIRNNGHDQVGTEITKLIMERLKFSNEEIEHVSFLIKNHMRVSKDLSTAKVRKLKVSPYYTDLINLVYADIYSSSKDFQKLTDFLKKAENLPEERILPKCFVSGDDLISLGFEQGKRLGQVLKDIYERQLDGILVTKEDQLEYAKEQYRIVEGNQCLNC